MQSSNREIRTVKASKPRRTSGLIQGVALLGISTAAAFALLAHGTTATSNSAAATTGGVSSSTGSSSSSGASASGSAKTSATSDAINYRYGTIQLKVTKSSGKLTAVELVQAQATGGREGAFSYLVTDAISANGSSFGNLSGATYTTDAFKQALDNALAKL